MWLRPSGRNMRRRQPRRRRRRRRPLLHLPPPLRHTLSELPHSLPFFLLPRHNYSLSSPPTLSSVSSSSSTSAAAAFQVAADFADVPAANNGNGFLFCLSVGQGIWDGRRIWGGANASQPPIRLKEFLPQGAATNAKVCGGVGQKNKRTLFRLALQKKWREEPEGGACTQYLTLPART